MGGQQSLCEFQECDRPGVGHPTKTKHGIYEEEVSAAAFAICGGYINSQMKYSDGLAGRANPEAFTLATRVSQGSKM